MPGVCPGGGGMFKLWIDRYIILGKYWTLVVFPVTKAGLGCTLERQQIADKSAILIRWVVSPLWLLGWYKKMSSFPNLKSRQYWSVIFMVAHNHCRGAHKPEGVSRLHRAQVCRDSLGNSLCASCCKAFLLFLPLPPPLSKLSKSPSSLNFPYSVWQCWMVILLTWTPRHLVPNMHMAPPSLKAKV